MGGKFSLILKDAQKKFKNIILFKEIITPSPTV